MIRQIANEDNKPRPDLLGKSVLQDVTGISKYPVSSGMRDDDRDDSRAGMMMRSSATLRNLGASIVSGNPAPRIESARYNMGEPMTAQFGPGIVPGASQSKFFNQDPQPRPTAQVQRSTREGNYLPPAQAELNSWRGAQADQNKESLETYISNLVEKVASLDNQGKQSKAIDKVVLDAKDEEIRTFLTAQRKGDESRRVEIENRLRDIFKEKNTFSSGYSPAEGFMLSTDFILTYFSRFEDVYIRFAVYLIGDKISRTYRTGKCLAENYLANMNRVFFGERQVVENIDNDKEAVIIFEVINVTNQAGVASSELVGWSMLRLFDDAENFL